MTDNPDRNSSGEPVFEEIEQAIISAARKHLGEESQVEVHIDRATGECRAIVNGQSLAKNEIGDLLGRIGAETAKRVIIEKIREAERDATCEPRASPADLRPQTHASAGRLPSSTLR